MPGTKRFRNFFFAFRRQQARQTPFCEFSQGRPGPQPPEAESGDPQSEKVKESKGNSHVLSSCLGNLEGARGQQQELTSRGTI